MMRTAILAALLLLPGMAQAQVAQTNVRYDEDWSAPSATAPRDAHWWEKLKARPLDTQGDVSLTLGGEARARYEGFADNLWGQSPTSDDGYLWLRFMPLASVKAGPARAFVQGIAGDAVGVAGGPGPADRTGIDLLQGFVDAELPFAGGTLILRGGRELVALGSERLVGTRYGPNIPQPFDGARVSWQRGALKLEGLHLRPVAIGPGNFDDRSSTSKRLDGIYATLPLTDFAKADLYWLHYGDAAARFGGRMGYERRDTFGARLFGKQGALAWNWEAMLQRGSFAGQSIRAWSIATETAYMLNGRMHPRLRLRANIASGDRDPADGRLGTFNAMFPKGKYFGELSPIGPRNIMNIHPSIDADLGSNVTVEVSAIAYWRFSRADGVYDVPGQLVRPSGAASARHIGNQAEISLGWQATPILGFAASASIFQPGNFIRQTGSAQTIQMIGLEAMLRF
ncbi:alginate export family protein [Sphingobium lignivorans]|uniref:Alginate export domain-containing protein n=1 Tax=Sphingobium lignivorans TaxID=2735886 RepID=A0ABR6NHE4_9SPHN|nr:alginate export family protein [Sphingobium lignivorans]MBB5986698.1 hypothetical protein [Sphingobium lignivorans]